MIFEKSGGCAVLVNQVYAYFDLQAFTSTTYLPDFSKKRTFSLNFIRLCGVKKFLQVGFVIKCGFTSIFLDSTSRILFACK